jgi:hypothetical protein
MLDLSKLPSPCCVAGRVVRRREELLRRRAAAAMRALGGEDGVKVGAALSLADALVARHASVRAVAGPATTKVRPGGRVVTSPSIALEIQEVSSGSGPQGNSQRSLLTRFFLDLLASFRVAVAAQPGQLSITDLPFVPSLRGGRSIPTPCLTPRLAARPRTALALT